MSSREADTAQFAAAVLFLATWSVSLLSQGGPDLSGLPAEHRDALLYSCRFQEGNPDTYVSCLNLEFAAYRQAAPPPDLSDLPADHRDALLYSCRLRQNGNPANHWACLNREFADYRRAAPPQNLDDLPADDRYAIFFACELQQSGDFGGYWTCLARKYAAYQRAAAQPGAIVDFGERSQAGQTAPAPALEGGRSGARPIAPQASEQLPPPSTGWMPTVRGVGIGLPLVFGLLWLGWTAYRRFTTTRS